MEIRRKDMTVKVDVIGLDEASEKAQQLNEQLKKASSLVKELAKELADVLRSLEVDVQRQ